MVQNLSLSIFNMNHSNMSISSSVDSIDSSAIAAESNVKSFEEIPLTALSKRSLRKLSHLLNTKKILRSEEGYERDWRGLASLAKQKCLYDGNVISGDDPMAKVIQLWCTNNPKTATFAFLEHFLGIIDRWDVSDDIFENLVDDTKAYRTKLNQCTVLNSEDNVNINSAISCNDYGRGSDSTILTTSDVICAQKGLPPQMYDAFVLYADADLNYASEILTKLEDNPEYNIKLCLKDRDLLGGVQFEHVALTQLIEERCKHLIVILTQEFLKSPENKFLVNYTQALQIQHKTRKIVPLLYEEGINIPRTLKIYTHLRYNQGTAGLFNFWSKLANSIQNVNMTTDAQTFSSLYGNAHSNTPITKRIPNSQKYELPNPPNDIARISTVPPEDNDKQMKKGRAKLKPLTKRSQKYKFSSNDAIVLRDDCSIDQLQTLNPTNYTASMSDLSTSSICSENKKKKKWSSKILKKVFSRSSSKLLEV